MTVIQTPFAVMPLWALDRVLAIPHAVALYMTLSARARRDREASPGRRELADALGVSMNTIDRTMRALREAGVLSVEGQVRGDGGQGSNLYTLPYDEQALQLVSSAPVRLPLPTGEDGPLPTGAAPSTSRRSTSPREEQRGANAPRVKVLGDPVLLEGLVPTPSSAPSARPRDVIWDALAEAVGAPSTAPERSRFARSVRQLRQIEASPDEIRRRARNHWPDMTLTDRSVVGNWTVLDRPQGQPSFDSAVREAQAMKDRLHARGLA